MKFFVQKQLNGTLIPCYESDWEYAKKLKPNKDYQVEIKQPRNIKFHRKFFALIKMVFENQEQYINIDRLRKDLTIEAGYYENWTDLQGVKQTEAKSISFAKMDEFEFSELYNKIIDVIVKYFRFEKQDIIENIAQYY